MTTSPTNGHPAKNGSPAKHKVKPGFGRRDLLKASFAGSLAAMTAGWVGAILKYLSPPPSQGFGGQVYAGRLEEFPAGSVTRVMAGRFYLSHTSDGLLAIYQKCTHLGCAVPWTEKENNFHCPCHGSVFTPTGEVAGGPAPRPLDIFPVEIKDGEVWVDTSRPLARTRYESEQALKV